MVATDLVDTLSNDGPFTVFAPNNDAFNKLADQLGLTLDELLNLNNLKVQRVCSESVSV